MAVPGAPLLPTEILSILTGLTSREPLWLVGGAVRDRILQRPIVDYDFVVQGDAIKLARQVANQIAGDFYTLDEGRGAGRVIFITNQGRTYLDFARMEGGDLKADLMGRDFSINAMAQAIEEPGKIIDPAGGLQDLMDGIVRIPSSDAIASDPIRALRAIRLAVDLKFKIEPQTYAQVKQAGGWLARVSPERQRDELFRILALTRPALAMRLLDHAGLLKAILPDIASLRGQHQPPPHEFDVLEHTFRVVDRLTDVLAVLSPKHDAELSADLALAEVALRLGRFRVPVNHYLSHEPSQGRSLRQLLYLSALFHDSGKPAVAERSGNGATLEEKQARRPFLGHEEESASLVDMAAIGLRLSNAEREWLEQVVGRHMRPMHLAASGPPSRRAIYRFYRQLRTSGVAVALLSMADHLGKTASPPEADDWKRHIDLVRALLEPYFEAFETMIHPPRLLDGGQLMKALELDPGPLLGEILEAIMEAQAIGEVSTQAEALAFARRFLEEKYSADGPSPKLDE